DYKGNDCFIGLDLSKTGDLTSCSFIFPILEEGIRKYAVFSHSFIPAEVVFEKSKTDNVDYKFWESKGYLTLTTANDGLITDYWEVLNYIENIKQQYSLNVIQIGYDAHGATMLVSELESKGYECIQIYQSCAKLNEPTISFRDGIMVQHILHDGNNLLSWAINNAETDMNSFGEIKLSKISKFKRIDPAAASIFGYKLAMEYWNNKGIDINSSVEMYLKTFN
ncbi:MAG: terminase TerL endonuclease subunit, partial [Cetobacterium sp.]